MTLRFDWSTFPFVHRPRDYQLEVLDATWDKAYHAYFMWPRTGKTKLTIDVAMANTMAGNISGMIIIAKSGEYQNWPIIEIPKHWNPDAVPYDVEIWDSQMTYAKERDLRARLMDGAPRFKILCINVESLLWRWERKRKVPGRALSLCFDFLSYLDQTGAMLVVDEATCVKNHDANRSQGVYALRARAKMRRILTGTPVTESPLHLWGQSKALGENLFPFPNFTTFRAHHAVMEKVYVAANTKIDTVVGLKNLDELMENVAKWSTTIGEEVLNLLPPTRQIIPVPLDEKQQKYYNQLTEQFIAELEDGRLVAPANKLAALAKMHQVVCGHIKLSAEETLAFSKERINHLLAFLEPRRHKCIIWANYRQSVESVHDALAEVYGPNAVAKIYGGTKDRMSIVQRYQDPTSELRFLVANQLSAGYGLTLDQARTHVYFANEWSGERRVQSEQRGNNPANPWSIEIVDLVTPGTIDQRYYQVLKGKSGLLSDFMKGSLSAYEMLHPDPSELIELEEQMPAPGTLPPDLLELIERDLGQT